MNLVELQNRENNGIYGMYTRTLQHMKIYINGGREGESNGIRKKDVDGGKEG